MVHRKIALLLFLYALVRPPLFAENSLVPGMSRLVLEDFLIFSGRQTDRSRMLSGNFSLSGFAPYNGEPLVNSADGDNYHVFKTYFTVSDDYRDDDISFYIGRFDMPVVVRINGITIYQKGLKHEIHGAYSPSDQTVAALPLQEGLIDYGRENFIVVEVFPLYETSPLPELSIAEYRDNAYKVFIKNLLNVYLVMAAQFVALLVAVFHFSLYIARGCKDTKYILFSFLSFSFALAYANIGITFDFNYYTALIKITRCFQLLCTGFFALFVMEISELYARQKKYIMAGISLYSAVCAAYIAVQNNKYSVNAAFSLMSQIYMVPVMLFCICITVISIVQKKKMKLLPFLASTLFVAAGSLRDMLLLSRAAQPLFWYTPYAYLFLVIVIYGILVYEESSLFRDFKRFVPADLVIQLVSQNITAKLGGKQQELTVFFSDITKFTSIAETMEPEKLIQDLCVYFEGISKTILANNGTIDKYIGDAVMAFWGAPLELDNHAQKACEAAITIRDNLHSLFNQWDHQGKALFPTRIGIHTGNVLVGNIGYKERLNYTVIGDSVNISSRLEGINKTYGTEIIVSENTHKACRNDFEFRLLDRVSLLGRHEGMLIYELVAFKGEGDKKLKKLNEYYESGLQYYFERNWDESLQHIDTVLKYRPDDKPSLLIKKRCVEYQKNPPPEQWDGVFAQISK